MSAPLRLASFGAFLLLVGGLAALFADFDVDSTKTVLGQDVFVVQVVR